MEKVKVRQRHAVKRVRRLKAVASKVHSATTFIKPRGRNLRTLPAGLRWIED